MASSGWRSWRTGALGGMDFGLDLEDFYIIFTYVHGFPRFISRILLGLSTSTLQRPKAGLRLLSEDGHWALHLAGEDDVQD